MSGEGNWSPGEKVPRSGTYKCIYCGPDGFEASTLKHTMKSMGAPYTPPPVARMKPPKKFLKGGEIFPRFLNGQRRDLHN